MKKTWGLALATLLIGSPLAAQELEVGGEVRPRFEARDPVVGLPTAGETLTFTSMRARASIRAALSDGVTAFVQLQDVRVWGTELSTVDPTADALDLHQGWIEIGDPAADDWALRIGRQEVSYGGQRLIGALNWAQQARSFDGLRLRMQPAQAFSVDAIAMTIGNADRGGPRDERLYGLYGNLARAGGIDGYVFFNTFDEAPSAANGEPAELTDQVTVGARWQSGAGVLNWRVEGAYQLGERLGDDVAAYLLAVRAGTRLGELASVNLWYDRLSGDDDPTDDEIRVFDTLFATNHKFYGHMDFFLNIPVHTAGRGLQDLALKGTYDLEDDVTLSADFHAFFLTATDGIESGHIGEELDLGMRWAYAPGVTVTGGLSYFVPADAWTDVLRRPDDDQVWGYLMLGVLF